MLHNTLFNQFDQGQLYLSNQIIKLSEQPWSKHPVFNGVELKHLLTAAQTEGEFSYHLVRIAPHHKIGRHQHLTQIETHEVIAGQGCCLLANNQLDYRPGIINMLAKGIEHEIIATEMGLLLFAKFIPALC